MNSQSKFLLTESVAAAILLAAIWYAGVLNRADIRVTLAVFLAVFIAILGMHFFTLQIISRKIRALRSVISAVSKGETEKRAKVGAKDEIGILAKDLNKMVESLQEARRLPENILRSMKDGLFVVDTKGNIQEVNRAILEMLGYKKEELVGKPLSVVFTKRADS